MVWRLASLSLLAMLSPVAIASPAFPHDMWGNGVPIPTWVLNACCGQADAHRLRPDQVHRVPDGYRIDGYPHVIFDAQVLPSEDGEYWAFYKTFRDADGVESFSTVFCFFAPSAG